jgi:hypothetical protein
MKLFITAIIFLAVIGQQLTGSEAAENDAPIALEKYNFVALFDCKLDLKDGKIVRAKVTETTPPVRKYKIGRGDQLVSVNGREVVGMEVSVFQELMQAGPKAGMAYHYVFKGARKPYSQKNLDVTNNDKPAERIE